jgi:hypothetical protein
VPFDKSNEFVLGGSAEPYVNNPLRQPEVSSAYRSKQKDKVGWDDLCLVLHFVEAHNDPAFTEASFRQVLLEIHRRLSDVRVSYPVLRRIGLARCLSLVDRFTAERSGGDRVQAVAAALFQLIGRRFRLYANVRRSSTTAPDASSGQVADLECVSKAGEVVLAVEVKDRELTVNQISYKLPAMRSQRVSEILFIAQHGVAPEEREAVDELIDKEFTGGQNVYVFDLRSFAPTCLALVGESGRREFLELVGAQLEAYRSGITHRKAWANLLSGI